MKMKKLLVAMLIMVFLPLSMVYAEPSEVDLQSEYVDPNNPHSGQHRTPPVALEVWIDNYTLSFITPCNGCTLRLLDENDNVVYTTVISSSTLVLPSTLSGEYKIEIISGNYLFWGYVYL